jgi:2-amino-4-hydroxy-6-hydroxymethyldihydropteridine diphosphokinase
MAKIYLGLGSNRGDRLTFLKSALAAIAKLDRTSVDAVSSVYETEPVGKKDQNEFFNAVVEIESTLSPQDLLREVKRIEHDLGRKDPIRWGPREIDIDILYYDDLVLNDESLQIPHGEVLNRRFALIPLNEIAPGFVDPVRRLSIGDLLKFCSDTCTVRRTKFDLSAGGEKVRR